MVFGNFRALNEFVMINVFCPSFSFKAVGFGKREFNLKKTDTAQKIDQISSTYLA